MNEAKSKAECELLAGLRQHWEKVEVEGGPAEIARKQKFLAEALGVGMGEVNMDIRGPKTYLSILIPRVFDDEELDGAPEYG